MKITNPQILLVTFPILISFFALLLFKEPGITMNQQTDLKSKVQVAHAANYWLQGWANRIEISIDHTRIGSPLTNFPVLLHLSKASGISHKDVSLVFEELENDNNRKKIAVTTDDGYSECFVEIQKWDTNNKNAFLWVKVPHVSDTEDTRLFLYFDKNHADNTAMVGDTGSEPAAGVWTENYVAVHHLEQKARGLSGEFLDSTEKNNNGTGYGVPQLKPGKIGGAQYFDGDNDYILIPDSDDFSLPTTGKLTIGWWFGPTVLNWRKNDGSGDYINMLGKGGYPNGWEWCFGLGLKTSPNKPQQINLYHHNAPGGRGIGVGTSIPYDVGEWIYVVGRFNETHVDLFTFYPSGLVRDTNIYTEATGYADAIVPTNTWSPVSIGTINTQWQMYEGLIDELHISNVFRSDDWIIASYYSETDSLLYYRLPDNRPPVLHPIGNKTFKEGETISFTISAIDPEGDPVTYSASNLPQGAIFDVKSSTFSWTPARGLTGIFPDIRFEASDGEYTVFEDITLIINKLSSSSTSDNTGTSPASPLSTEPVNMNFSAWLRIAGIALGVAIILGVLFFFCRYYWLRKHV